MPVKDGLYYVVASICPSVHPIKQIDSCPLELDDLSHIMLYSIRGVVGWCDGAG